MKQTGDKLKQNLKLPEIKVTRSEGLGGGRGRAGRQARIQSEPPDAADQRAWEEQMPRKRGPSGDKFPQDHQGAECCGFPAKPGNNKQNTHVLEI